MKRNYLESQKLICEAGKQIAPSNRRTYLLGSIGQVKEKSPSTVWLARIERPVKPPLT
jgi:hypothetical protein